MNEHDQLRRDLEAIDLTPLQRQVLEAIIVMGDPNDEMLGKYCGVRPKTITKIRGELERKGLIGKPTRPDPNVSYDLI